ncbi:2TM domain-containing protein [Longimicrobium sp.]|uniref:2TM domain-containing protein n=1 Tax=Longimicrobium sp. TaxID=2029185 RepID=UPI002E37B74E|nr:2TM domain-containing protein [Longimicrobium sp.]HEX6042355.1 2TM domain-containing protein [Longimicrobium sp.]
MRDDRRAPPPARSEQAALDRARRRARRMTELRDHWMAWFVCGGGLAAIDGLGSKGVLWFPWPVGAYGVGLAVHCAYVVWFGEGSAREERMLARELERHGG